MKLTGLSVEGKCIILSLITVIEYPYRQHHILYLIFPDIDALIREEVSKLGSREGGLSMIYGLYPGVPLENVKALMDAMEKYAFYYS